MFHGSDPSAGAARERLGSETGDGADLQDDIVPDPWPDGWVVDHRPTLLMIAASGVEADIGAMATGAGFRVAGSVPLDEAAARLALTVGVDALVVDLRGLQGTDAALMRTVASLTGWPGWSDTRPLVLVDFAAVEAVLALAQLPFDALLCDPCLSDIGAALCLLARGEARVPCLEDAGRESEAARLEQLSAEVRRLAQTIDRLARDDHDGVRGLRDRDQAYTPPPAATAAADHGRNATGEEVRAILHARRLRERFLPADLFADPAWDMMLDLMGARIDRKRVSVSSLCIAASVPPTTALRWIAQLTDRGIFERRNDPDDARRVFISLSEDAAASLAGWFSAARRSGIRFVQ